MMNKVCYVLRYNFMLLRPMLFIDTIAICSWDTCITDMLVTILKEELEKGENNIKKMQKEKGSNYANLLHYMHKSFKR
jgi:hypothetical protein